VCVFISISQSTAINSETSKMRRLQYEPLNTTQGAVGVAVVQAYMKIIRQHNIRL